MELTLNPITFVEQHLAEIAQTVNTKFSFAKVNEDGTVDRLHEWIKCRDFLGDVLLSDKYQKDFEVYGFRASRVKRGDKLEFVVKFPDEKVQENFLNNYSKILHPIEEKHGLKLTDVKFFKNLKEHTVLITADEWWTKAIPLISLYSYLIKVCCYAYTNPTDWMESLPSGVEGNYISGDSRKKLIEKLLSNLRFVFSDFPTLSGWADEQNMDTRLIHNSSGFYTLFMNTCFPNNTYSAKFWGL
jgi:hypothetical protein